MKSRIPSSSLWPPLRVLDTFHGRDDHRRPHRQARHSILQGIDARRLRIGQGLRQQRHQPGARRQRDVLGQRHIDVEQFDRIGAAGERRDQFALEGRDAPPSIRPKTSPSPPSAASTFRIVLACARADLPGTAPPCCRSSDRAPHGICSRHARCRPSTSCESRGARTPAARRRGLPRISDQLDPFWTN